MSGDIPPGGSGFACTVPRCGYADLSRARAAGGDNNTDTSDLDFAQILRSVSARRPTIPGVESLAQFWQFGPGFGGSSVYGEALTSFTGSRRNKREISGAA